MEIADSNGPRRYGVGGLIGRVLLWIGIFLIPFIFSWLTLRKGFSVRSRLIAFGWLAFWVLVLALGHSTPPSTSSSSSKSAAAATEPPLSPEKKHARDVAEARVFWASVNETTNICDKIAPFITRAIKLNDVYNLYENANTGKNNCIITMEKIKDTPLPEHASDEVKAAIKDGLESEANGYAAKEQAYGQMADMANGGAGAMRPSDMDALKQTISVGQLYVMQGVAKLADAFSKEGVKLDEYAGSAGPRHHRHEH